jgi:hypothetical protein
LKLQYDEPLSKYAFNFNLRRYIEDDGDGGGYYEYEYDPDPVVGTDG